jgi:benzoylformate decarboxylase
VLANGGYAVMDQLMEQRGGSAPWPGFGAVDVSGLSRSLGCPATRIREHDELVEVLDDVVPGLRDRKEPLLLEVVIAPDQRYGY